MKKSSRSIHRVGVALAALALCGLDGDHRLGHAVHADLDPVDGHPAVQDLAPEYRQLHPDGRNQLQRRAIPDGGTPPVLIGPTVGVLPFEKSRPKSAST